MIAPNAPHSTPSAPWQLQALVMSAIREPDKFVPWNVNNETAVHHQARAVIVALKLEENKDE